MADDLGKKISELPETTDLQRLYTIGTDKNTSSKKVSLEFLRQAADYANTQGDYAKSVGDTVAGNVGATDYPVFSASGVYAIGDVVRYADRLYRFTAPHQAGAWNGADVELTSINEEAQRKVSELKQETDVKLTELESELGVEAEYVGTSGVYKQDIVFSGKAGEVINIKIESLGVVFGYTILADSTNTTIGSFFLDDNSTKELSITLPRDTTLVRIYTENVSIEGAYRISIVGKGTIRDEILILDERMGNLESKITTSTYNSALLTYSLLYYGYMDGIVPTKPSANFNSGLLKVSEGDKVIVKTFGVGGAYPFIIINEDGTYNRGLGELGNLSTTTYVVESGVGYIGINCHKDYFNSFEVLYIPKLTEFINEHDNRVSELGTKVENIEEDIVNLNTDVFGGDIFNSLKESDQYSEIVWISPLFVAGRKVQVTLVSDNNPNSAGSFYAFRSDSTYVRLGTFINEVGVTKEFELTEDFAYLKFAENSATQSFTMRVRIEGNTPLRQLAEYGAKISDVIVVDAYGNGDYDNLIDAIRNAGDTKQHPKTIIVKPGIYYTDTYKAGDAEYGSNRYLSIIGIDKNNCIIASKNGVYINADETHVYEDNAPLRLGGNCYIANLTIRSTSEESHSDQTYQYLRSYCVHFDFEAEEGNIMEINNCNLYNDHWSVFGIGARKGYEIRIVDCDIHADISNTTPQSPNTVGAIYMHGTTTYGGRNGKIIIKGCKIHAIGTKAFRLQQGGDSYGTYEYELMNNIIKEDVASTIDNVLTKSEFCFGNNKSELNY